MWKKGEIAQNEQFLLFPSVFQSLVLQMCENQGLFGKGLMEAKVMDFIPERVNRGTSNGFYTRKGCIKLKWFIDVDDSLTHSHTMTPFDSYGKHAL